MVALERFHVSRLTLFDHQCGARLVRLTTFALRKRYAPDFPGTPERTHSLPKRSTPTGRARQIKTFIVCRGGSATDLQRSFSSTVSLREWCDDANVMSQVEEGVDRT